VSPSALVSRCLAVRNHHERFLEFFEEERSMTPQLLRRLNTFDLALISIGLVIGSGIFRTPAVVAQRAHVSALALGCWFAGGLIALIGAFIFGELASRRPLDGGLYGYLKDAYHPMFGFVFGWTFMLIVGTGSNAAAAVLFAGYLEPLTGLTVDSRIVASGTLLALACINLLGVRQGSNWQNAVGLVKVGALVALIVVCLAAHPNVHQPVTNVLSEQVGLLGALGVAMLPVLFSYNGFQNATFLTGETVEPGRTIPRALLLGMIAVILLYVLANFGYLHVLGVSALASSKVPAAAAMDAVVGPIGEKLIAVAIALSTLGYLSTCMLVHPRLYYQMAADGLFFRPLAWVSPVRRVPVVAILVQAGIASAIALSGSYEQIINWVVLPQWLFSGLAAIAIFIFRKRDSQKPAPSMQVPGHPYTTGLFIAVLAGIFVAEFAIYPRDTMYGVAVLATGVIVFAAWQRWTRPARPQTAP
jgi:APA family basic amino acid/polyamine antiporter